MSPVSLVRQLKAIQPSNIPMYVKLLNAKKVQVSILNFSKGKPLYRCKHPLPNRRTLF